MFVDPNDIYDVPNNGQSGMSAADFAKFAQSGGNFFGVDFLNSKAHSGLQSISDFLLEADKTASQRTEAEKTADTRDEWINKLTNMANNGNIAALETLFNYYATRSSELEARDYASQREDTQYQRLVKDLQKAGISPYILSGASPVSLGYSTKSYSGSAMTSAANNVRSAQTSEIKQSISSVLSLIGVIVGALIMAA